MGGPAGAGGGAGGPAGGWLVLLMVLLGGLAAVAGFSWLADSSGESEGPGAAPGSGGAAVAVEAVAVGDPTSASESLIGT